MSDKGYAWYEDPALEWLYVAAGTKGMRGYHAPISHPKITFTGTNSLEDFSNYLGAFYTSEERRLLMVVDKDLERMAERVVNKLKALKGFESRIFANVQEEAPKNTLKEGIEICKEFDPKGIIGIGGGSAMDTAKGIFLFYEKPEVNINNLFVPSYLGLRKKIKLLMAIPTTSGTGSEATYTTVITDTDREPPKKTAVTLYELCPDVVVLHVDFVKTMPQWLTVSTAMDAFGHAVGAYMLVMANIYMDIHCLKAVELILKYAPRAYRRGEDLEAREKMQMAAYLAGIGFSNGSTNIEHALGHSFGAIFHVHHGTCIGIFTLPMLVYSAKVTKKFIDIAKIFNIEDETKEDDEILRELLINIKDFMKRINFPASVQEIDRPRKISFEEYMEKMEVLIHYAYNDVTRLFSSRRLYPEAIRRLFIVSYENNIEELMEIYYK